eukprot:scaffold1424_cov237-Pinguiococcus_pyrenoidosus.AAC.5
MAPKLLFSKVRSWMASAFGPTVASRAFYSGGYGSKRRFLRGETRTVTRKAAVTLHVGGKGSLENWQRIVLVQFPDDQIRRSCCARAQHSQFSNFEV